MSQRPRVLLADDNDTIRAAITTLLSPSCDVIGYVSDVPTLFETTATLLPDVVLLDLSLPGGLTAIQVCRQLTAATPSAQIVVFTALRDSELERLVREAGASAFVWKMQAATELVPTIHAVVERRSPASGAGTPN